MKQKFIAGGNGKTTSEILIKDADLAGAINAEAAQAILANCTTRIILQSSDVEVTEEADE